MDLHQLQQQMGVFFFGATLCLAVTMHYYATLLLVPYALWEAIQWKPWRPPSPKLIAGSVGIIVPSAILLPLVLSFARVAFSGPSRGDPSLAGHSSQFWSLLTTFSQLFPDGLFLLALLILMTVLLRGEEKTIDAAPVPAAETLGWLFLTLPLVGFIVAQLKTHAFVPRYFIGALPPVAVAFACWTWRYFLHARPLPAAVLVLLAACGIGQQFMTMRDPEPHQQGPAKAHSLFHECGGFPVERWQALHVPSSAVVFGHCLLFQASFGMHSSQGLRRVHG
jgi:hypothetical protein